MLTKPKIIIVGAGHVGSHCALSLAQSDLCAEIVLTDIVPDKAAAQAADIADSLAFSDSGATVREGSLDDAHDADFTVLAIGKARMPGQTRLDLVSDSALMYMDFLKDLRTVAPGGIVITITNPADIVTELVREGIKGDRWRIFGTGTLLDTFRLYRILTDLTGVNAAAIDAVVMGEHGDSSMIPFSQVRIAGKALTDFGLNHTEILTRTRMTGMDIINGKGSTEFGIAKALEVLVRSILTDARILLPLSVSLDGEYGKRGIAAGVPCIVGAEGIREIVEIKLTLSEKAQFNASCETIANYLNIARETLRVK